MDFRADRGDPSARDPLDSSALPYEASAHILSFVPLLELANTCPLVCRRWREFLSNPHFWKSIMKERGNFSVRLNEVKNVIWPKLCYYTVCRPNMIKSFDKDTKKLCFTHWKTSSTNWDRFKLSSRSARQDRGGGNHWEIEDDWIKPVENEDVYIENGHSAQNYVTSYGWCCREQLVRLSDVGLSDEIMDTLRPTIEVSEWFCARWDCGSVFCIHLELLDARKQVVKFFEHSVVTEQWLGGELGWRRMAHDFKEYEEGVRYLRFADAGKDTQFWAGHYGSKMAAAVARVRFS